MVNEYPAFGTFETQGPKMAYPPVLFNRLAFDVDARLLMVEIVADSAIVKGLRGALNTNGNIELQFLIDKETKFKKASQPDSDARPLKRTLIRREGGYVIAWNRMGYNMTHALITARDPGFLPAISEAHVWHRIGGRNLTGTVFTTPLLREWTPWIFAELKRRELLVEAFAHNCTPGMLLATVPKLDAIVTDGIRGGHLKIAVAA